MSSRRFLVIDFETRSEAPLKKTGSWEYSLDPSTRILCVAWRLGTRSELRGPKHLLRCASIEGLITHVWSPYIPSPYGELVKALCDPEVILVAHNALFEQAITKNVLSKIIHRPELKNIPPERWLCTAALAASLALPRNLLGACSALGLTMQKDVDGHKLMMKMCKPRKVTKKNPRKWHDTISDLKRLMQYCATDVDAETELFLTAKKLNPLERKIWELDQRINLRGFAVDEELIDKTLAMIAQETSNLNQETDDMTWGGIASATQRAALLKWLDDEGVKLPNLKAKTITDALAAGTIYGDPLRLLQIRQAISKTSTAKYNAFKIRSRSDLRVRDNLVYHAASTGRWGGAGVQPQNFPKPSFSQEDIELAIDIIKGK